MKRGWLARVLMILGFLGLVFYGLAPLFLPTPAPASIPLDQFSAGRAMRHVSVLAQIKRVAGTPGMDQAASYLVSTLKACHLAPEIQVAPSSVGLLRNVVVRLEGSQPGNALLILSHPDSISYGAGDNASGAAVLLETACALNAGQPLKNDIIFLFDDGEEAGYLGGYAFAKNHIYMIEVRRVIGLDTAAWGPVVLLQTTPSNASFIHYYASSVRNPTAFGFLADADWNISQDTSEITPFYAQGIPGMALEDPTAFKGKHSDADTLEKVKEGSLQQMGEQVIALGRSLGNADLMQPSTSDQSYFTLWKIGVVHYPADWNFIFVGISTIGLAFLIGSGIKRKALAGRSLVFSGILLFLAALSMGLVGVVCNSLFKAFFPNTNPGTDSYLNPASLPFFLLDLVCVIIIYSAVRARLVKKWGAPAVLLGGFVVWLLFSVILLAVMRVGSAVFSIPLLVAVLVEIFFARWNAATFIAAGIATVLFSSNVTLAFLGGGLETLVLINILVVLAAEFWAARA
jgi:hypothetical protein